MIILHELDDYPLAPDKIEIRKETLSNYQLKITIFTILLLVMLKLVHNVFDRQKYVLRNENLQLYLMLGLKVRKICCVLEFNQSQ